jgi:tetratricopeptide (TPR) repeat protein
MPQTTPKIAACLITKGDSELETLKVTIASIKPYVDDIFITSSSEYRKTKAWCKGQGIHHSFREWDKDFGTQRNFNWKKATDYGTYDFLFWCDSDDELVGGEYLKEIASKAIHDDIGVVFFDYLYACTFDGEPLFKNITQIDLVQPRERLIKPGTHTWKNRLHETPVPISTTPKYVRYRYEPPKQNIVIVHRDVQEDFMNSDKMKRNKELLELQLSDERQSANGADPRTLLNLIKIYVELDDPELWKKALEMGEEYLPKSGWDEERAICHNKMAQTLMRLGRTNEVEQHLILSIGEFPHDVETKLLLAEFYLANNQYDKAKHWMDIAMGMDIKGAGSSVVAVTPIKIRAAKLMLKWAFHVEKNIGKAVEASNMLIGVENTQDNLENHEYLLNLKDMDEACGHIDKLTHYLSDIGQENSIVPLIDRLPMEIQQQPFAIKLRQKFSPPRKWGDKEICYFANFGNKHFEVWDGNSLKTGIGGSETAVIKLSEEWVKQGYNVVVYGDPKKPCVINGVKYFPYYWFNMEDSFNILIQWRANFLAGKVKAKKFLVDLHDIFNPADYNEERLKNIDKIMVKSNFHRELAPNIPDNKIVIISNCIN